MRKLGFIVAMATSAFALSPAFGQVPSDRCDLPKVKWMEELDSVLSLRAIEAINLAATSDAQDTRLEQLVNPSATFRSGGGDVGIPLGQGVQGARALARDMRANTYRYIDRAGLPIPLSNPCIDHEVTVEFMRTAGNAFFP